MMASKSLAVKYVHIAVVVGLYWTVSISTVFVNKTLLSNENLDIPFFILWYQCFISVIICLIIKLLRNSFPNVNPFKREAIANVLPVSILLASMIVFNALCLKYVGVAFYYIGRSLTTIFNVILTFLLMHEKVSGKTLICCSVIVTGFFLGIDQETVLGTFSLAGTLSGIISSLCLALYSVYTKKALPYLDNNILLLSFYNNIYSCLLLFPFLIFNDEISKIINYENILDFHFWLLMSIGGIFGFSMGYVTSLQIKVTSPLTHNISGTAKACVQTLIATYWFEETKSILWWISNFVILYGSFAYARVKQLEMETKP